MPKSTPKNSPRNRLLKSKLVKGLLKKESKIENIYSIAALNATIAAAFLIVIRLPEVMMIANKRISGEMINFLLVAFMAVVATTLCGLAIYKTPNIVAKLVLTFVMIIGLWIGGFNIFVHLVAGGFESYRYAMTDPPDPKSAELEQLRKSEMEHQGVLIKTVANGASLAELSSGYMDSCVQGFMTGFEDARTDYTYKCIYRTNIVYGSSSDIQSTITRLHETFLKQKWSGEDISSLFAPRENVDYSALGGKNIVETLSMLEYYKNERRIDIRHVNINLNDSEYAKYSIRESERFLDVSPVEDSVFDSQRSLDSEKILQEARQNGYNFVLILSTEHDYFKKY